MSKRIAFAAALLLIFAPVLSSAEDAKKALIHDLMKVIGAEDLLRQSIEKTIDVASGSVAPDGMSPEDQKRYEEMKRSEVEHRSKVLQRVDIRKYSEQVFYPLFDRYTISELKDAIAYYKTPSGQKSVKLIPELATAGVRALRLMGEDLATADRDISSEEQAVAPAWKRTMADLRTIATATEAYATDTNQYPQATTLDELDKFLSPTYIRTMPRKDGWGNEYTYIVSPDHQHYRFVSAGADGQLDYDSTRLTTIESELKGQQRATSDPNEDIIYQDGSFVRYPKEAPGNQ
jgi:hypothetical protein